MAKAKNITQKVLLILLFLVFPLGQIPRLDFYFNDYYLAFHTIDVLVILLCFVNFNKIISLRGNADRIWIPLSLIFGFSFSFFYFGFENYLRGFLYLIRVVFYYFFILLIGRITVVFKRETILKYLEICLYFTALFGWLQYFLFPDLRNFINYGWDDHLFRLVGTLLDPGFTGVMMSLASVFFLWLYLTKKNNFHLFSFLFFTLTTFFTYSRASLIALLAATTVYFLFAKRKAFLLSFPLVFIASLFLLPRPPSSGVELERRYSVSSRLENYKESIILFSKSPVFGVGFNNICSAREKYGLVNSGFSHSCSGLDSSLLQILATTGVIGILIFVTQIKEVFGQIMNSESKIVYLSLAILIFIHSLFVNSLFYPWLIVLLSFIVVTIKRTTSRNEA